MASVRCPVCLLSVPVDGDGHVASHKRKDGGICLTSDELARLKKRADHYREMAKKPTKSPRITLGPHTQNERYEAIVLKALRTTGLAKRRKVTNPREAAAIKSRQEAAARSLAERQAAALLRKSAEDERRKLHYEKPRKAGDSKKPRITIFGAGLPGHGKRR